MKSRPPCKNSKRRSNSSAGQQTCKEAKKAPGKGVLRSKKTEARSQGGGETRSSGRELSFPSLTSFFFLGGGGVLGLLASVACFLVIQNSKTPNPEPESGFPFFEVPAYWGTRPSLAHAPSQPTSPIAWPRNSWRPEVARRIGLTGATPCFHAQYDCC